MGLSQQEIMIIVNRWIGVKSGYLGDFSYRTHAEFYAEYCGIDANPDEYEGTTRERFIQLLTDLPPRYQAKVVRGVLERFPIEKAEAPATRHEELATRLVSIAERIERGSIIATPSPEVTSDALRRALGDAETLMASAEAGNAVDRVHTAFHAYLIALCENAGLDYPADPSMTRLFKDLRQSHTAFVGTGPRAEDITNILRAMASIIDSLMPVRNMASLAHPNPVLADPEALLVINSVRTLFHYLDAKLKMGQ